MIFIMYLKNNDHVMYLTTAWVTFSCCLFSSYPKLFFLMTV